VGMPTQATSSAQVLIMNALDILCGVSLAVSVGACVAGFDNKAPTVLFWLGALCFGMAVAGLVGRIAP
jgi:hypothetical protein